MLLAIDPRRRSSGIKACPGLDFRTSIAYSTDALASSSIHVLSVSSSKLAALSSADELELNFPSLWSSSTASNRFLTLDRFLFCQGQSTTPAIAPATNESKIGATFRICITGAGSLLVDASVPRPVYESTFFFPSARLEGPASERSGWSQS